MLSLVRRDSLLIGILFLALVLRLAYTIQASGTPLSELLLPDSEFRNWQAKSQLAGKEWTEGVFFMCPDGQLTQVPGDEVLRARVDSLKDTPGKGQR
jgi:hypothetical protein